MLKHLDALRLHSDSGALSRHHMSPRSLDPGLASTFQVLTPSSELRLAAKRFTEAALGRQELHEKPLESAVCLTSRCTSVATLHTRPFTRGPTQVAHSRDVQETPKALDMTQRVPCGAAPAGCSHAWRWAPSA